MTVRLVVALPLIAALAGLLARRHTRAARSIATFGMGLAFLFALIGFIQVHGDGATALRTVTTFPALRAGELQVPLQLATSPVTSAIALIVALVATFVQMYAVWYLHDDDRYAEFAASVSLFSGAMLLVVHSSDLVLTLIGWEVMGWVLVPPHRALVAQGERPPGGAQGVPRHPVRRHRLRPRHHRSRGRGRQHEDRHGHLRVADGRGVHLGDGLRGRQQCAARGAAHPPHHRHPR